MINKKSSLIIFFLLPIFVAGACINSNKAQSSDPQALAQLTFAVLQKSFTPTFTPTQTYTPGPATATPINTRTPTPTQTQIPSLTPVPSRTITDTPTRTTIPTLTPYVSGGSGGGSGGSGGGGGSEPVPTSVCHASDLITMITIPNGTVLPAGTRFIKIWRIKNTGECTWDDNFRFVYAGGDAFSAKLNNPLPHRVRKGQTVDMALEMIAPPIAGEFVSRWGLFDERIDFLFGHGDEEAFPVRIQTTTNTSGTIFNFVNNLCTAQWVNGSDAQLLCNRETRRNGYAVRKNISPDYDPDNKFNALVTHTQVSEGGSITGKYPYIPVPPNARLIGEIGCTSGNQDCDITMRIYYQVYGRPLELLNEWHEVYDDQATQFDFNLDGLRNQSVAFYLYVEANAAPGDAAGYWHALRLEAP